MGRLERGFVESRITLLSPAPDHKGEPDGVRSINPFTEKLVQDYLSHTAEQVEQALSGFQWGISVTGFQ